MVEIVVKIMEELISTLALVTNQLKERKRGEFALADVSPYSAQHRQTQETFEGQGGRRGYQGGPTKVGQTYAR